MLSVSCKNFDSLQLDKIIELTNSRCQLNFIADLRVIFVSTIYMNDIKNYLEGGFFLPTH